MKRFYWRVAVIASATAACGLICVWVHLTAIATVGAIPLVLFLPGSALVIAVDPTRTVSSEGLRLLWPVATSMALSVLGGLLLNETTGLDRMSWVVLLCGFIGVSLMVGLIRAKNYRVQRVDKGEPLVPEKRVASSGEEATRSHQGRASLGAGLLLCVAIALVVGAVALSQHSVTTSNPKFIELWMTPTPLKAGASAHVAQLGVDNLAGVDIVIIVRLDEGGQRVVDTWYVSLLAGQVWDRSVSRQGTEELVATVSYASRPTKIVRYVDLKSPVR